MFKSSSICALEEIECHFKGKECCIEGKEWYTSRFYYNTSHIIRVTICVHDHHTCGYTTLSTNTKKNLI